MTRSRTPTRQQERVVLAVLCFCCLVIEPVLAQEGGAAAEKPSVTTTDSLLLATDPASALGTLVQRVADQVIAQYERPWGRVVERRRSSVYVVPQGTPPEKDKQFLVLRPVPGMSPSRERLICKLKVKRVERTVIECKEFDRTGKDHAEEGDIVREENVSTRGLAGALHQCRGPRPGDFTGTWRKTACATTRASNITAR